MRRTIEIISSSFKMAMQELLKNKLRTFLSLFGVTIGIFCIIGVLATVSSLQHNIQTEIKSMGNNTIYIDKWNYGGGPDYPWWKYVNRPEPKYDEVAEIKQRTTTAKYVAFQIRSSADVEAEDNVLSGINIYGVTEDFTNVQTLEIQYGRFMSQAEFKSGSNAVVIGNEVAAKLFGDAERAVDKTIKIHGRVNTVAGVIKKQGAQLIGGWDFDQSVIMTYNYARNIMDEHQANPSILVHGQDDMDTKVLKDDLNSAMRGIRKLSPTQEDNFSLNDINELSDSLGQAFVSINIGGWSIGILSFIVGIFGVANIMFVTVKERTSQIGLKKAIGAKSGVILTEFLVESAFLCILGGIIGLLLVFILTKIVTAVYDFPIFLSAGIILTALVICLVAGIIAGIVPASQAARLNPVIAIRSS